MKEYNSENIRNISIIGSAQTGKTSLGDAILFNSGATTRLGKVNDGTSLLDNDPDEIEKQTTINSALFYIDQNNNKMNFLDTPGYPAFVSQALTAINVCENSLFVLSADQDLDIIAKRKWHYSEEEKQSKFVFINKMERHDVDFFKVVEQAKTLSNKIHPIFIPIGNGENISGIVDIINQKAYIDTDNGVEEKDIPEDLKAKAEEYRASLMEIAAENSEELLEKYLDAGELTQEEFLKGIKLGINTNDLFPLMVGSAHKNIGIRKLMDTINTLACNPLEKVKSIKCTKSNNEEISKKIDPNGNPLLFVFKILDEAKTGETFFLKVIEGKLTSGTELTNPNNRQKERIGHLYTFSGKNKVDLPSLNAGDIGAIAKLKSVQICHTLCSLKEEISVKPISFPGGTISQAIRTESEKDREKLGEGLQALNKVDPCFRFEIRPEFNEMVISGMSQFHLDVLLERIKTKYKIELSLDKPQIPYRETISSTSSAQGKYKKQTGGHGQYGDCFVEIKPKTIGEGYSFENKIAGGVIPAKYIPAVEKGVKEAMTKGIMAGYPVVDVNVKLYDGSHHNVDSSDLAFQMAGILAFKNAAQQAKPILLEPILKIEIIVPENFVGDITADINQRRGKIGSMDSINANHRKIDALVPMAEMDKYSVDLKSMTKGEGTFDQEFLKYEAVPANIAQKLIDGKKKEKEED